MRLAHAVLASALLVAGCAPRENALHVDLRTDLAPGIEFGAIRTEVQRDRGIVIMRVEHAALLNDPYLRGLRVADFDLPPGDYRVQVTLLDGVGAVVDRTVAVQLASDLSVTVVVTRSCRSVTCGATQTCVGGACVDPGCTGSACAPECTSAATCPLAAACATVSCVSGSCFYGGVGGACAIGEWCNPDTGCEALPATPDAGMRDAATGIDAGPGHDAGSCTCAGRACGDDGCGTSCGSCGSGTSCIDHQCTSDPPDCAGLSCGPAHDGIGGPDACGSCGTGTMCSGGTCVATPPDCSGLACGPAHNGIGGADACGSCGTGFTCAGGACQCGGFGAGCASGSCCGSMVCTGGACCEPVQQPCGAGCCPGRMCDASRGVCCVVLGDGCSSDAQCCGSPGHTCVSGICCVANGNGCARGSQCCSGTCTSGTCR